MDAGNEVALGAPAAPRKESSPLIETVAFFPSLQLPD